MPDRRTHRGPHPEDARLFDSGQLSALRQAVAHVSWLLTRGYGADATLKLVGDRFALTERQRKAVMRCSCSDQAQARRKAGQVAEATGRELWIDGFNLITTVEAALAGGVLLLGRDGAMRDLASMHGSYRRVEETAGAIALVADLLHELGAGPVKWWLDRPVSNSGRLADWLRQASPDWEVELVADPDRVLASAPHLVATSDSAILDRAPRWLNLAALVVARVSEAWIVDLALQPGCNLAEYAQRHDGCTT